MFAALNANTGRTKKMEYPYLLASCLFFIADVLLSIVGIFTVSGTVLDKAIIKASEINRLNVDLDLSHDEFKPMWSMWALKDRLSIWLRSLGATCFLVFLALEW